MSKVLRVTDGDFEQLKQQADRAGTSMGEAFSTVMQDRANAGAAPASSPAGAPDPADPPKPAPAPAKVQLPAFDMDPEEPEDDYDPKPNEQDVDPRGYQVGGIHVHLDGDAVERALAVIGGQFQGLQQAAETNRERTNALALIVAGHTHDDDGQLDEGTDDLAAFLSDELGLLPEDVETAKEHVRALQANNDQPAGQAAA